MRAQVTATAINRVPARQPDATEREAGLDVENGTAHAHQAAIGDSSIHPTELPR